MTEQDIEKLAELSKIKLPEGEAVRFAKDFDSILGYVKQIESVDVGDITPNFFLKNILRTDTNPNETGALSEALLAAAPETHDGFVKVNKIL
jgi:aspartyl-tRNA(Asn)/glutamyl-tRNA(Gln) amidotransferase subunit C